MEYIIESIPWIFSGIGATIIGYLINRSRKQKRSEQGVTVDKSKRVFVKRNINTDIVVQNSNDVTIEGNKYEKG